MHLRRTLFSMFLVLGGCASDPYASWSPPSSVPSYPEGPTLPLPAAALASSPLVLRPEIVDVDTDVPTWIEAGRLRRFVDDAIVEVGPAPDVVIPVTLRMVADDDGWLLDGGDLWHFDGTRWTEVSFADAVEHVRPVDVVWVDAITADTEGEAFAIVDVWGQGDGEGRALREQLCHFGASSWTCERVALTSEGPGTPELVLSEGVLWTIWLDGVIYRQDDDGTFGVVYGGDCASLRALDDGSVVAVCANGIVRVDTTGATVLASSLRTVVGRHADDLHALRVDVVLDGSCRGSGSAYCRESVVHATTSLYAIGSGFPVPVASHTTHGGDGRAIAMPVGAGRVLVALSDGAFVTR